MDIVLLPETMGYKANLHSHTMDSDGYFTPEELKEFYHGHGYSMEMRKIKQNREVLRSA